jgi:hypothetical protein
MFLLRKSHHQAEYEEANTHVTIKSERLRPVICCAGEILQGTASCEAKCTLTHALDPQTKHHLEQKALLSFFSLDKL